MAATRKQTKQPALVRPTASGGPWLTVDEAAARAGISEQTLHNLRAAKSDDRPLGVRLGRRVWYSESEIDAFVNRRKDKR